MKRAASWITLIVVTLSMSSLALAAPGDILITEITQNPSCVGDTAGEYVELTNVTGSAIDLDGWTLSDDGADSHVISGTVLVAPGAYAVLCRNSDFATNGGVTCDYQYAGFSLGNSDDEVVLTDTGAVEIDRVNYDGGPSFPDPAGASMSLEPGTDHLGNDNGSNWCTATEQHLGGCGDLGSPGRANPTCACADGDGDFYVDDACGGLDCDDLDGAIGPEAIEVCDDFIDNDCDALTDAADPDCSVPVVCGNGLVESGEACDDGGTATGDGCDDLCAVEAGWACRAGTEPSLCGTAAVAGDVVITEIIQNPDCVSDTNGEWFEIRNDSGVAHELCGWSMVDGGTNSFVIPALALPAGSYAVLCSNSDTGANGNVTCDVDYSNFFLGNGSDSIVFSDPADTLVDQVVWDDGATFPDPTGASMSLDPGADATSNDVGFNWCVAVDPITGGCGDLGTPGLANPACPPCPDADGDSFTDAACGGQDCDDSDGNVNPDATEICDDAIDNDCDTLTDGNDDDCAAVCGNGVVEPLEGCDDNNLVTGDGCDDMCQVEPGWACRAGIEPSLCGTAGVAGDVVITEILQNPGCVADADGEWFEIRNATGGALELEGWVIADGGSNFFLIPALTLPAGANAVLCTNGDTLTNGGVTCDLVYSNFTLGNGSDSIVLSDPADLMVDTVVWDDGATFPDPTGAAMSLTAWGEATDNDDGANWCEALSAIAGGCGDLGTPGAANPICPVCGNGTVEGSETCDDAGTAAGDGCDDLCQVETGWACRAGTEPSLCGSAAVAGDLVVTEIMHNPACVDDGMGEWIEIQNPGAADLELRGWLLSDGGFNTFVIPALSVPAGGLAVLCTNANPATNGNVACDLDYANFFLANSADSVILSDPADTLVDRVTYDNGATFPNPDGATMSLNPGTDATGNDVGANWCDAVDAIPGGCGDLGTPGADNPACVTCPDADGDGYFDLACGGDDCDDSDFDVNPGATEVCTDGIDNDCDTFVDTNDPDCPIVCGNGVVETGEACDDAGTAAGDGCDDLCQVEAGWACRAGTQPSLCGTVAVAGDVVVTEIMQNPSCVTDGNGEWFEIRNDSAAALELRGWSMADAGSNFFVIPGLTLAAGGRAVLCNNGDTATNGNVTCDLVYTGFFLGNGSDEVILSDPADTLIDQVAWDDGATFPDPSGASMSLTTGADATANDDGANWCVAVDAIAGGCGDLGTPGAANPGCVCPDADGDGFTDLACGGEDCDDSNFDINPGVAEVCDDGIDNDCDTLADGNDPDCGVAVCGNGVVETGEACDDNNAAAGDGCDDLCQVEAGWACRSGIEPSLCGQLAAAGDMVVTEVMQNPNCVSDTNGEWFEIQNDAATALELRGWSMADGGSNFFVIPGLTVAAGGRATLCNNGDTATNGNVTCDLVYTGFFLGNSSDSIILSDPADTLIDQVVWDDGATFPDPDGASMSLTAGADATDNDDGSNWCEAVDAIAGGCGDLGTPGAANPACAVCPDADGDGHQDAACGGTDCDDSNFDVNPDAAEVCDDGIDNDCDTFTDGNDPDCGVAVCGNGIVETGEACDDNNAAAGDGCDDLCQVEAGWACRAGIEPSLCGQLGTTGDVVVTEVMQNPSCVSDGDGEWFEIVNVSGAALTVRGWAIADNADTFVIPDLALAADATVVLCVNGDVALNGNVVCDLVYTNLFLGNGSDQLIVSDAADTLIDQVAWDDGATFPDPNGASMSLTAGADATDNDDGTNWCEAVDAIAGGCGDLGTPGAANPACAVCPDADGDGHQDAACGGTDCDDSNFDINPDVAEVCDDGIDNDCDTFTDGNDPECGVAVCGNGVIETGEVCDDSNTATGDGCDDVCQVEAGFACRADIEPSLCGHLGLAGDVIVTEIMQNPACVGDSDGEWFEIENATGAALALGGWRIYDGGSNEFVIPALTLPAGGFAVLCGNADPAANGNVTCDLAYDNFFLANGSDGVNLADATDTLVDEVIYDDGATFPDPTGASMSLTTGADASDNDNGANWCEAVDAISGGCGDLGTPGAANPACCPDADADGYQDVACGGTDCDDANFDINPGVSEICDDTIDNDCDGDTDSADPECTSNCGDGVIGLGEACDDGNTATGDGCDDLCQVEAGWACRAGTEPSLCGQLAAAGDVVVTEIMQNPSCVSDSDGEYLEIHNVSGAALELRGWRLFDGGTNDFVIPALLLAADAYGVLCINGDTATNGNVTCDAVVDNFFLANASDGVNLADAADTLVDAVVYDDGATFPDPTGASMSLTDGADATMNDDGANWCEALAAIPGGCGDLGTPGAANPVCTTCEDADGDGYADVACGGDDCDDANIDVNPGASEVCDDSIDNDCDTLTDMDDPHCSPECGDGVIAVGEACDDANNTSGDGCNDMCEVEAGWVCRAETEPSLCGHAAAEGEVIVNEIMNNPGCVNDSEGEWVEVLSTADRDLELRGWIFGDLDDDAWIIPGLLLPAGGTAVLCRNDDTGVNGNVTCDLTYASITLGNGEDEVVLWDPADTLVDQVAYDDGATFPDPNGASMSLTAGADATGNDDGTNWCEATDAITDGCGDFGTPGAVNPACGGICADDDDDGFEDEACGGTDCDDTDETVFPGATEVCDDGIDQDCNGSDLACTCEDADGDGYEDAACGGTDCDDDDGDVNPGAVEVCDDGVDNDCDDDVDDDDTDCGACHDVDADGYDDAACGGDDCDDSDADVNPGADEACDDTIDNNCDGLTDGEDEACGGCPDADGDGFDSVTCGGSDCDDTSARVYPGADEICDDGLDNDCDGHIDQNDPQCDDGSSGCGCGVPYRRGTGILVLVFLGLLLLRRRTQAACGS